jgi:mannose-6-phosphate isomerase-like protein (cupin superfamily)
MAFPASQGPVNLTVAAERMSWAEVRQSLRIRASLGSHVLQIHGLAHAEDGHPSSGVSDTVYVIVSGFGMLRWGITVLECTAGDVLFVPQGYPHRFERLDGATRIWRIWLGPVAAAGNEPA